MGVKSEMWISLGLIFGLEFFLLVAVSLSLTAMSNDRTWDRIMEGELKFPVDSGFFANKSMVLEEPDYSEEKALLTRPLQHNTLFVVFCLLLKFIALSHAIILYCVTFLTLRGRRTRLAIVAIYITAGIAIFIASVLAATSCSKIGDNYVSVMHLFYQRVQRDSDNHLPKRQDYATTPIESLDEALLLMDLIGVCMGGSLHTALNPEGSDKFPTLSEIRMIGDENVYDFKTLTRLHFCQLEGHKVAAVIFGLLSTLTCLGLAGLTGYWLWKSVQERNKDLSTLEDDSGVKLESGEASQSTLTLLGGDAVGDVDVDLDKRKQIRKSSNKRRQEEDKKKVQQKKDILEEDEEDDEDEEDEQQSALSGVSYPEDTFKSMGATSTFLTSAQQPLPPGIQEGAVFGLNVKTKQAEGGGTQGSLCAAAVALDSSGSGEFRLNLVSSCSDGSLVLGHQVNVSVNVHNNPTAASVAPTTTRTRAVHRKTASATSTGTGMTQQSAEEGGRATPGWRVFL